MALVVFCAGAHAQSSVSIYGIIDAGLTYIDNEAGITKAQARRRCQLRQPPRLSRSEDLGDGLKAVFQLENGFNLKTGTLGQSGRIFGRQAFVGLQGSLGSVTMGRQFDAIRDYFQQFNYGGYASVYAGHQGDFDRVSGKQFDNSVRYASPIFGGFSFSGLYSFGEQAESFKKNSAFSLGAGYKQGGLSVGGAYVRINNAVVYPYLQTGVYSFLGKPAASRNPATGVVTDLFSAAAGGFKVDTQTIAALGASYSSGAWSFAVNGSGTRFEVPGARTTMKVFEAGAYYTLSPFVALLGGYQHAAWPTTMEPVHRGRPYNLSKRTWLYANVSVLKASSQVDASQGAASTPFPRTATPRTRCASRCSHLLMSMGPPVHYWWLVLFRWHGRCNPAPESIEREPHDDHR